MQTIRLSLVFIAALLSQAAVMAETPAVVTTIKPLHSLVSGVLGDTGRSELLLRKTASPHHYQLKPSQVKILQNARIIFYIDERIEIFLHRVLPTLPDHVRKVEMIKVKNITLLERRTGGVWEDHHDHHGHDEHGHDDHGHDKHGHDEHAPADADDAHIWLSPDNAKIIVATVAKALGDLYPENRKIYQTNAQALIKKIGALDDALKTKLRGIQKEPFVVFHDAYQYFENHYGLSALGSITFEPEEPPSPARIKAIQQALKKSKARCIFREPQFSTRFIHTAIEGLDIKIGTLDPLGVSLTDGESLYFELLGDLAENMRQCLSS